MTVPETQTGGMSPAQPFIGVLEAVESDPSRYPELDRAILGGLSGEGAVYDLSRAPGWAALDEERRRRVVRVAARFLEAGAARPQEASGGYLTRMPLRAMALLHHFPEEQAALSQAVWERYGPFSLSEPARSEDRETGQALIAAAFQQARGAVTTALVARLPGEGPALIAPLLALIPEACWDDDLPAAVLHAASTAAPCNMAEILTVLLKRRYRPAVGQVRTMIAGNDPNACAGALLALAAYRPTLGGRLLAAAVQANTAVGEAVLDAWLAGERHGSPLLEILPSNVVADLYLWFVNGPAPLRSGVPRFYESLREGLMRMLVGRGEIAEVRRIADVVPTARELRLNVGAARNSVRRNRWQAPAPADVLRLTVDRRRRLVRSADELLDVIAELLREFQRDLRGDTPMAYLLWNNVPRRGGGKGQPTPKDEESLSDVLKWYVTQRLEGRGIVLNREVQIRRGGDGWRGERLDLLIEAFSEQGDVVSVIVEVKGSWNEDWEQAMQTQLAGRYLKENRCRHGLYLLGYFPDGREAGKLPPDDVARTLRNQAELLTRDGLRISSLVLDFSLH